MPTPSSSTSRTAWRRRRSRPRGTSLRACGKRSGGPQWWVRINPLGSEHHKDDLEVIGKADIHGIVLPKAESGADVVQLAHRTGNIPIHAIVTETAASLFGLMSYSRSQFAAGGDELGRRRSVGRPRRLVQI